MGLAGRVGRCSCLNGSDRAESLTQARARYRDDLAHSQALEILPGAKDQSRSAIGDALAARLHVNRITIVLNVGHDERALVEGSPIHQPVVRQARFIARREHGSGKHGARQNTDQHCIPFHGLIPVRTVQEVNA